MSRTQNDAGEHYQASKMLFEMRLYVHTCIHNIHTHTHLFSLPTSHTLLPPSPLPPTHTHSLPTITAYLTHESVELQELAANSDRLIASLVEYLQERPDENDDLVQEKHFTMFDNLTEVCVCV